MRPYRSRIRVWRVGFGEALPLRANTSAANMAENRRIEFLFARKAEAPSVWLSREPARLCRGEVEAECRRAQEAISRFEATPITRNSPPLRVAVAPVVPRVDVTLFTPLPRQAPAARPEGVAPRPDQGPLTAPAPAPDERSAFAPEPARRDAPAAPDERRTVVIERATPVLIDLRERKVLVGRPER